MSTPAELLERFSPRLRFDSLEPYFADSAEEWTAAPGQRLVRRAGDRVEGERLTLAFLGATYADGVAAETGDLIEAADERYAARYHELRRGRPDLRNVIYGRAVPEGDELWLQYWFFYFLNDYRLAWGIDVHEGDWEMIQLRVPAGESVPVEAVYAQHTFCETRGWGSVELDDGHPVVYVGRGSHASFFAPGYQETDFYDITDGGRTAKRGWRLVDVTEAPGWLHWPGHWGGRRTGYAGPSAPCEHEQWARPSALLATARAPGDLPPAPGAPRLTATREDAQLVVGYDATALDRPLERLVVTVNLPLEADLSPRTYRFAVADAKGTVRTGITLEPDAVYDVRAGAVDGHGRPSSAEVFTFRPAEAWTLVLRRRLTALAGRLVYLLRRLFGRT